MSVPAVARAVVSPAGHSRSVWAPRITAADESILAERVRCAADRWPSDDGLVIAAPYAHEHHRAQLLLPGRR